MNSLISPDNTWALSAIIAAGVALSIYLERRYRWGAKLSGPVIALLLAMLLTNLPVQPVWSAFGGGTSAERIMPVEAPVYAVVSDYLVPVAVVLLLLQANLGKILKLPRSMFLAFHLAAIGTLIGNVIAAMIFRGHIDMLPEASGLMAASYIGGGVNFFAVQATYDIPSDITSPLLVADNFVMAAAFVLILIIVERVMIRRFWPHPHIQAAETAEQKTGEPPGGTRTVHLGELAAALGIAFCIAAVSAHLADFAKSWTAEPAGADQRRELLAAIAGSLVGSKFVWITLISVTLATLLPRAMEKLQCADIVGTYLLYVFLFVIGLPADLAVVVKETPAMFGFCLVIAVANIVFALLAGFVLRLNLEELVLAINATLGGPPTAAAMAAAKGWDKLVLPGLLAGIWGYIIGTFVGVIVVEVFRRWLVETP